MLLQAAPAAAAQESLGVLEVVVAVNDRSGNFSGFDRSSVIRCGDADHVRLDMPKLQLLWKHPVLFRGGRGDHHEERSVNPVRARGKDAELAPFFAAIHQELAGVLEIVAIDDAPENPLGGDRRAIGRDDEGNLTLRHDRDWNFDDAVLPRVIAEVQAWREGIRLITRFPCQGHESSRFEPARAESFHHHADLPLGNQHRTQGHGHDDQQEDKHRNDDR